MPDPSRIADLSNRSIRELEVELRLAINDDKRTEALARRSGTFSDEGARQRARGKVVLVQATLEGLAEDLADEIDRLKLESARKDAELERAEALRQMKLLPFENNKRLLKKRRLFQRMSLRSRRRNLM